MALYVNTLWNVGDEGDANDSGYDADDNGDRRFRWCMALAKTVFEKKTVSVIVFLSFVLVFFVFVFGNAAVGPW